MMSWSLNENVIVGAMFAFTGERVQQEFVLVNLFCEVERIVQLWPLLTGICQIEALHVLNL